MGNEKKALSALSPDSIIFDIDGTLWDSRETVAKAWNEAFKKLLPEYKLPTVTKEILTPLFGKTMDKICDELLPGVPVTKRQLVADRIYEIESEYIRKEPGRLYEGVAAVVKELSKSYPLYIVSNCQLGYIDDLLDTTGLGPFFKDGLCYGDTGLPKEGTIRAMVERHGLSSPVYVGDTYGDAKASKLAGVPFIWASYGFGEVDEKDRIAKIENISDLLYIIKS